MKGYLFNIEGIKNTHNKSRACHSSLCHLGDHCQQIGQKGPSLPLQQLDWLANLQVLEALITLQNHPDVEGWKLSLHDAFPPIQYFFYSAQPHYSMQSPPLQQYWQLKVSRWTITDINKYQCEEQGLHLNSSPEQFQRKKVIMLAKQWNIWHVWRFAMSNITHWNNNY